MIKIYDKILEIKAVKSNDSNFPLLPFCHIFDEKVKAGVYGLDDGSILIKADDNSTRLWKEFTYTNKKVKEIINDPESVFKSEFFKSKSNKWYIGVVDDIKSGFVFNVDLLSDSEIDLLDSIFIELVGPFSDCNQACNSL